MTQKCQCTDIYSSQAKVQDNSKESKKSEKPSEASEEAFTKELEVAKKKLRCEAHSSGGREVYCYVVKTGAGTGAHKEVIGTIMALWCRLVVYFFWKSMI